MLKNTPLRKAAEFTERTRGPCADLRAATRKHRCHDPSARALGALPGSPACSDARVRSVYALTTPLHKTRSFTTAHLPRCAQRRRRAVLVKEIDDEPSTCSGYSMMTVLSRIESAATTEARPHRERDLFREQPITPART